MSMYTTPVDEQVDLTTDAGKLEGARLQSYVLDRFVKAASERDLETHACLDEAERAIAASEKAFDSKARQKNWSWRLGACIWWLSQYKALKDIEEPKPRNRDIASNGAEFIVKPANSPRRWLPDDELEQTILDAELPDEMMDDCFSLTVAVPATEAQVDEIRAALADAGYGITVTRVPDKNALKKCLADDGRTLRRVDEETGEVTEAYLDRRVTWQDPPEVPATYKVIAPDGREFIHNPLDDPEPGDGTEQHGDEWDEEAE